jgi:predicted HTH transcriptional regulator
MATAKKVNINDILDTAASQLEARFVEIQEEIAPLRQEEKEVAEALFRLVGSYPAAYTGGRSTGRPTSSGGSASPQQRLSAEERQTQVMEYILANPNGVNGKQVAEALGISSATAVKAIDPLIEAKRIKAEGQRAGRKLFPA